MAGIPHTDSILVLDEITDNLDVGDVKIIGETSIYQITDPQKFLGTESVIITSYLNYKREEEEIKGIKLYKTLDQEKEDIFITGCEVSTVDVAGLVSIDTLSCEQDVNTVNFEETIYVTQWGKNQWERITRGR